MKGLILSGGKGTRLRPLTYTRAKQLLPLANKPVLFYAIESLVAAGITDIGIIVGDTAPEIEEAVGNGQQFGKEVCVTFIHQDAPLGLAHAVKIAHPFIGAESFVMFLGDNLVNEDLGPLVASFAAPDCPDRCRILLTEVADPSQFGVAELQPGANSDDARHGLVTVKVKRLVEKPKIPPSNLALVGIYFFDSSIFTAVDAIVPSVRGELEITDAIQWLIDNAYPVHAQQLRGYWIDTGKMEDILDANRQVLADIRGSIAPSAVVSADSALSGEVVISAGARIENSVIRGPVTIGERVLIKDAYIGPFTAVYHDAVVESSELEYSIVLEHAQIVAVPGRIEASLIGRYAEVRPSSSKPSAHKLMLGDHSRVGIVSNA